MNRDNFNPELSIMIRNFPLNVNENLIKEKFSCKTTFGNETKIIRYKEIENSDGKHIIIEFENYHTVDNICEVDWHEIDGKECKAERYDALKIQVNQNKPIATINLENKGTQYLVDAILIENIRRNEIDSTLNLYANTAKTNGDKIKSYEYKYESLYIYYEDPSTALKVDKSEIGHNGRIFQAKLVKRKKRGSEDERKKNQMVVDNVLEDTIDDLILQYENLGGPIINSNYLNFDNKLVIEFENFKYLDTCIRHGDVTFNGKNYNGERLKKLDISIRLKSKSLNKIGYLNSGDQIIMSDKDGSLLIELDTTRRAYTHKKETMISPYSLCVSDNKQIFVAEFNGEIVHQFDSNFKLIKKIDLENHELSKIECISVDSDFIYGGKLKNNKIIKWNINTGKLMKFVENIDSPYSLALDQNTSLFVASLTKFNERFEITSGSNCIFVLNKNDLKPLKRIEFKKDWLSPVGLFIDNDSNILTTAYRLLNGGKIKSKNRYIFKINKDGNKIENKIQLEDVSACQSISIYDKRLFATFNNNNNNNDANSSIKIISF